MYRVFICFVWLQCVQSQASAHTYKEILSLETHGAAGWEFFSTASGGNYLVVANFWDGVSRDMGAKSVAYSVKSINSELRLDVLQSFDTIGAHGVEHFTMLNSATRELTHFIAIPNYYGGTTQLWWLDESAQRFREFQTITSNGPGQVEAFTVDHKVYLAVGDNFSGATTIYVFEDTQFVQHQSLPLTGAASMAILSVPGPHSGRATTFLVAASYHNSGWDTVSLVYEFDAHTSLFAEVQSLNTTGAHDVEAVALPDQNFYCVFFSQDRDATSSQISSTLYRFDTKSHRFELFQSIRTDGAHAAEFFLGQDGLAYLAIANFGDRFSKRYHSRSVVLPIDPLAGFVTGSAQPLDTVGATDFEHFVIDGNDFLVVSNEGDVEHRQYQRSSIFRNSFSRNDEL